MPDEIDVYEENARLHEELTALRDEYEDYRTSKVKLALNLVSKIEQLKTDKANLADICSRLQNGLGELKRAIDRCETDQQRANTAYAVTQGVAMLLEYAERELGSISGY